MAHQHKHSHSSGQQQLQAQLLDSPSQVRTHPRKRWNSRYLIDQTVIHCSTSSASNGLICDVNPPDRGTSSLTPHSEPESDSDADADANENLTHKYKDDRVKQEDSETTASNRNYKRPAIFWCKVMQCPQTFSDQTSRDQHVVEHMSLIEAKRNKASNCKNKKAERSKSHSVDSRMRKKKMKVAAEVIDPVVPTPTSGANPSSSSSSSRSSPAGEAGIDANSKSLSRNSRTSRLQSEEKLQIDYVDLVSSDSDKEEASSLENDNEEDEERLFFKDLCKNLPDQFNVQAMTQTSRQPDSPIRPLAVVARGISQAGVSFVVMK